MESWKIWIEQCEAARGIEDEFGTARTLDYLVGEKFLNFLAAAETHPAFRAEIPAFVAGVKALFQPWQLAQYLETARPSGPVDPRVYEDEEDPEIVEDERQADVRRCANDLLLVEQAREWLLGGGDER
jgi:hypothetical protein